MAEDAYSDEIWRVIEEAPNYAVSNLGRVKRVVPDKHGRSMRILKTPLNDKGYPGCSLHFGGKQHHRPVHKLVCVTFHGPKPECEGVRYEVRHLDGNKTNNRWDNLAWGTMAENAADRAAHGTQLYGEQVNLAKLTAENVLYIRSTDRDDKALAEEFDMAAGSIRIIRRGLSWRHLL